MEIIFREVRHTYDETYMGHKYWFSQEIECDAISATANTSGFTPLWAVIRHYGWSRDLLTKAAEQCNARQEIAVIKQLSPSLFLVPHTHGQGNTEFLIKDLVKAANAINSEVLSFTHYGFVQNSLPLTEIKFILSVLLDKNMESSVRVLVWDIDVRFKKEMISILGRERKRRL